MLFFRVKLIHINYPKIPAPNCFNILNFAKKYKLIRIAQQNDWVVIIIICCIFLYIFMLLSLRRDSSVTEFLLQKFPDSTNNLLSWAIISFVFSLVLAVFVSQNIPIVPEKIADFQIFGYELNKFGFTFLSITGFYFTKNILTYLFFAGTGAAKKWDIFYFTASKFYFCFSIIVMALCVVHYFYSFDRFMMSNIYLAIFLLTFLFKLIFYIFHGNNILPEKWYYKFLYICTLQIVPVLVLWKLLFF